MEICSQRNFILLWQVDENRLKFFIAYILSNTRFLKHSKKVSFYNALASGWNPESLRESVGSGYFTLLKTNDPVDD